MRRVLTSITALLLAFTMTACELAGLTGDGVSPSPQQEPSESPSPAQWTIANKKPHSGMFGVAWDSSDTESPLMTSNRVNREVYGLVYDSLFVLDSSFELHESLCAEMTSGDFRVFTLTLRQDVVFHDGRPLTAQDVVSSFQTALSEASPYSDRLSVVDSVKAVDGKVEVVLNTANPRFGALLTFPILQAGDNAFPPSGTGPYMFDSGDGRRYLTAFSGWWRKTALPVGHIELNAVDRPDEITYLMSVGDVSIVTADVNDSYGISYNGNFDVWEYPTPAMYYIGFNLSHPMLSDKRVRQALSCAFDRAGIASEVFKNAADPAVAPVSPALYDTGGGYDLLRYTALADETGLADTNNDGVLDYADGRTRTPFELRFLVDENDRTAIATAEFLASTLADVGVSLIVEALPRPTLETELAEGNFGLYCAEMTLSSDFRMNRWGINASSTSIEEQCAVFIDEMPVAPLVFKRGQALTHWSEVTGIEPVYGNPFVNIHEWTVSQ